MSLHSVHGSVGLLTAASLFLVACQQPAPSAPATTAPGQEYRGRSARGRTLMRPAALRLSWPIVALALLVMLGVSVWLRTTALHFYFWVDEGISVGIASHPLSQIPSLMRRDGSPPRTLFRSSA